MKFPALVYKAKGPYQRQGGTYNFMGVDDEAAFDAALKDGWFETLPAAIEGKPAEPISNAPPTRTELEAKAAELGIQFTGKTKDAQLGKLIADKLAAKE